MCDRDIEVRVDMLEIYRDKFIGNIRGHSVKISKLEIKIEKLEEALIFSTNKYRIDGVKQLIKEGSQKPKCDKCKPSVIYPNPNHEAFNTIVGIPPPKPYICSHEKRMHYFDNMEQCKKCGMIFGGKYPPAAEKQKPSNRAAEPIKAGVLREQYESSIGDFDKFIDSLPPLSEGGIVKESFFTKERGTLLPPFLRTDTKVWIRKSEVVKRLKDILNKDYIIYSIEKYIKELEENKDGQKKEE